MSILTFTPGVSLTLGSWNAGHAWPVANSATHPAFRNATNFIISVIPVPIGASLEQKADLQNVLTNIQDEALRQAGPDGCTYVNEVSSAEFCHSRRKID